MVDYLKFLDYFSIEEKQFQQNIKETLDKHVSPLCNEYFEKGEFPFQVIEHIRKLNIVGGMIDYPERYFFF